MEARLSPTPAVHLPMEVAPAGSHPGGYEGRRPSPALQPELWAALAELVHYAAAGVAGTIGHVLVMGALIQGLDVPAGWASTSGLMAGAVFNFHINHRWTFNSLKPYRQSAVRFATVAAAALLANSILMFGFRTLMLPPIPSQAATTGLLFVSTFHVNKRWSF